MAYFEKKLYETIEEIGKRNKEKNHLIEIKEHINADEYLIASYEYTDLLELRPNNKLHQNSYDKFKKKYAKKIEE